MKKLRSEPNDQGFWGDYGGRFVAETLIAPFEELTTAYRAARRDCDFRRQLDDLRAIIPGDPLRSASLRASPSTPAARAFSSSAKIFSTPARTKSITRSARGCSRARMGKRRIIAETGAGQHGVATATVCALLGLDCVVYMGAEDVRRQAPNVLRMQSARCRGARGGERHRGP